MMMEGRIMSLEEKNLNALELPFQIWASTYQDYSRSNPATSGGFCFIDPPTGHRRPGVMESGEA